MRHVTRSGASQELLAEARAELLRRRRDDGTFAARAEAAEPNVEATAWAAIAFALGQAADRNRAAEARAALGRAQAADGRLSTSPLHPGAYAPTALALLAWLGLPAHAGERSRALAFLLAHAGERLPQAASSPHDLDPTLAGWPWIDKTFSWCEPTALALLALEVEGSGETPRARQGRELLLDRQLDAGGWNYGNKRVFGSALRPAPESTGLVLAALAGRVPAPEVSGSLVYLRREVPRLPTPLALGWGILALAAWGERPIDADAWLAAAAGRAERYGGHETADWALLAIAAAAPRGLLPALRSSAEPTRGPT